MKNVCLKKFPLHPFKDCLLAFPIFKYKGRLRMIPLAISNDEAGIKYCQDTEQRKDFIAWAKNPYTSKINTSIKNKAIIQQLKEWLYS